MTMVPFQSGGMAIVVGNSAWQGSRVRIQQVTEYGCWVWVHSFGNPRFFTLDELVPELPLFTDLAG